jgi:hypothetical protein
MLTAHTRRADADAAVIRAQMAGASLELAQQRLADHGRELARRRLTRAGTAVPGRPVDADNAPGRALQLAATAAIEHADQLCAASRDLIEASRRLRARLHDRRRSRSRR